jgi:hypothetical protein
MIDGGVPEVKKVIGIASSSGRATTSDPLERSQKSLIGSCAHIIETLRRSNWQKLLRGKFRACDNLLLKFEGFARTCKEAQPAREDLSDDVVGHQAAVSAFKAVVVAGKAGPANLFVSTILEPLKVLAPYVESLPPTEGLENRSIASDLTKCLKRLQYNACFEDGAYDVAFEVLAFDSVSKLFAEIGVAPSITDEAAASWSDDVALGPVALAMRSLVLSDDVEQARFAESLRALVAAASTTGFGGGRQARTAQLLQALLVLAETGSSRDANCSSPSAIDLELKVLDAVLQKSLSRYRAV